MWGVSGCEQVTSPTLLVEQCLPAGAHSLLSMTLSLPKAVQAPCSDVPAKYTHGRPFHELVVLGTKEYIKEFILA